MSKTLLVWWQTSYRVSTNREFDECTSRLTRESGKFSGIEEMVTARIALADVVSQGFEALANKRDDHIKILVTPRAEFL